YHLYVLAAGGSIRKLLVSVYHHADVSADRAVRAVLLVDHWTCSQFVERRGHVFALVHCEEKRYFASGLHEPPASRRNALAGSDPRSQPGAVASDSDDHAFHYCRVNSRGHRHW